jgi:glutathione S-transferase
MYTLYNVKRWGSMAPHFLLEELDVPYQSLWMTPEQVRAPEFRDLSPLGYIPVLKLDDGSAVFESAAVVLFLTGAHPDRGMSPPPGTPEHGQSSPGSPT